MCGLVGVFGNTLKTDIDFFKQALVCDYFRGKHSTGIATVASNDKEPFVKKLAVNPIDFLDLKQVDSKVSMSQKLLIGHNRHATKGAVNSSNAHPFTHDNITLVHNGTLTNKYALERKYGAPTFDTDSELVCWLFANCDLDDVVETLEGAFAFVWWDSDTEKLNFLRNDERPFHVYVTKDTVYWASEGDMLRWLLNRNHISVKGTHVASTKVGTHVEFTYGNQKVSAKTKDMKLAPPPTYSSHYGNAWQKKNQVGGNVNRNTNVNRNVGNVATSDSFTNYNRETGMNFQKGDVVFAYINSIDGRTYQAGIDRVDLDMTLSVDPYTTVKAFYIPRSDLKGATEGTFAKCKIGSIVSYIAKGKKVYRITAQKDSLKFFDSEDSDLFKELDAWECEMEVDTQLSLEDKTKDPEEDIETLFSGFDGKQITWKEFKAVMDKGCAACNDPLDARSEALDLSASFVSHNEALCQTCANNPHTLSYFGYDVLGDRK